MTPLVRSGHRHAVALLLFLLPLTLRATDLTVFSDDGVRFELYLDGRQQGLGANNRFDIPNLAQRQVTLRVVLAAPATGEFSQVLTLDGQASVSYAVRAAGGQYRLVEAAPPALPGDTRPVVRSAPRNGTRGGPPQPPRPPQDETLADNPNNGPDDDMALGTPNDDADDEGGDDDDAAAYRNLGSRSGGSASDADSYGSAPSNAGSRRGAPPAPGRRPPPPPPPAYPPYPPNPNRPVPQPGYGRPGPRPVSRRGYAVLIEQLRRAPFSRDRFDILEFALRRNLFTTRQVAGILQQFPFDSEQLRVAREAYFRTLDPENYPELAGIFTFSSTRRAFYDFLRRNPPPGY